MKDFQDGVGGMCSLSRSCHSRIVEKKHEGEGILGSFIMSPLYFENKSFLFPCLICPSPPSLFFSSCLAPRQYRSSYHSHFQIFCSLFSENFKKTFSRKHLLWCFFWKLLLFYWLFLLAASLPICYILLILSPLNTNPFRIRT